MASSDSNTVLVFCYGSNMLTARIQARCRSASCLGIAELRGYELRWHKRSIDGSGKCDVVAGSAHSAVFGVVYTVPWSEKADLDRAEGLGNGYDERTVSVRLQGNPIDVALYSATNTDAALKPYTWYVALVVEGARQHGLPPDYVSQLAATEAVQDANCERHDLHMAILQEGAGR
ncbi:MAG: gamma-glutamylcyclotransferase [Chromatiales bacterium]|nr:gamma-glutamylcyclotransferase [Chromatiales bacterium]